MHRRLVLISAAAVAAMSLPAAGCGSDAQDPSPSTATRLTSAGTVRYRYGDSSVAPPYHRSYTIEVTSSEAHVVVTSYGDTITDTRHRVAPEVWAGLGDGVDDVRRLRAPDDTGGCAGGTSRELRVTDSGQDLVDMSVEVCGGTNAALADAIDAYIAPVIDGIDDFAALLQRP